MNPITRKEMFLAAAGGQDVTTPTPVTREEVFLDAIAKGGGGGGGSSGGGVLVVKFTAGRDGWTCDKTYAEIVSAITSGTPVVCFTANSETGNVKYNEYTPAVNALFFEVGESTLYVTTLTVDSSDSVSELNYSITLT